MSAFGRPPLARVRALARALAIAACAIATLAVHAQVDSSPDAALTRLLQDARATLPAACTQADADRLVRAFCAGRIRIGVRESYPPFATSAAQVRQGYEIDVARALANRLGLEIEFATVNPATRIALLAEDRVDLTIATMGHNTQRDGEVRFIRPHYYQSETTIVGPRTLAVSDWKDLAGRTICVTIGNASNAEIVAHDTRLMLFDSPGQLPERLKDDTCALAAQDDSFFAASFADAAFSARFAQKFGFAQLPWGMAVARDGSERLARALDLASQVFHRDGTFLGIARAHGIRTGFLDQQHAAWQRPECNVEAGSANPACVLPALDTRLKPTAFADQVTAFESWFQALTGIALSLPMLKTAPAWSLFVSGVVNTLVLIPGALAATLVFALAFGAGLGSRSRAVRWPVRLLTVTLQSSPVVLTLVIAAAIAHAMFSYSSAVALCASIVALGLGNGANAGQAISEAMSTLRVEQGARPMGGMGLFARAVGRSATQIVAFLVNATKGTPIASFIGAPELLSALTDISSFSSGRATTYTLLLVFYTVVVMAVVWLCAKLRTRLERSHA